MQVISQPSPSEYRPWLDAGQYKDIFRWRCHSRLPGGLMQPVGIQCYRRQRYESEIAALGGEGGFFVGHARAALNTGTGNQGFTITWSGIGDYTPEGYIIQVTRATADATAADHVLYGIGASDGTNQWSVSTFDEHGIPTSDANQISSDVSVIHLLMAAQADDCIATHVSFAPNTVTINISDAPAGAYLAHIIAFTGTDAIDVGTFLPVDDSAVDVTSLGASANFVFGAITQQNQAFAETAEVHGLIGIGLYSYDGATARQGYQHWAAKDNSLSEKLWATWGNSSFVPITKQIVATDFVTLSNHALGFTATSVAGAMNNNQVGYLAISLPSGIEAYVGFEATKTSTGTQSLTDKGFKSQALFMLSNAIDNGSDNDETSGPGCDAFSFGAAISAASEYCMAITADELATMDSQSYSSSVIATVNTDVGTKFIEANVDSFGATQDVLNYTTVNGTARNWVWCAFKEN